MSIIENPESSIVNVTPSLKGASFFTPTLKGAVETGIEFTIYGFTIYDLVNIQFLESGIPA